MSIVQPAPEDEDSAIGRRRPGRPRRPGVTDRILRSTIELAVEQGLEEVTLEAVAVRAGVGRPTIYRRWPSKDALFADAIMKLMESYSEPVYSGNIRNDLVAFARGLIE